MKRTGTLEVMRWHPRLCAGMTTVFCAHLPAIDDGDGSSVARDDDGGGGDRDDARCIRRTGDSLAAANRREEREEGGAPGEGRATGRRGAAKETAGGQRSACIAGARARS